MNSRRILVATRYSANNPSTMAFTFGQSQTPAASQLRSAGSQPISQERVGFNFKFSDNFLAFPKCKAAIRFQWKLDNIGQGCVYISNMIEFHNQKMFRLALKNHSPPTLLFSSINHRQIGLKIVSVSFWTDSNGPIQELVQKGLKTDFGLHLFSKSFSNFFGGNCIFYFEVEVGTFVEPYCYQLDDNLMRGQLWKAAQGSIFTDMEFIVKDKTFAAHKFIVSARSPVFAAMFNNDMLESKTNKVKINDIDPSCFERFLEFIYTGQVHGTADDSILMKVADKYQIDTLKSLCQIASQEMNAEELTSIMISMQSNPNQPNVINRSVYHGDVTRFPNVTVIEFIWTVPQNVPEGLTTSTVFEVRNEKLFRAGLDKRGNNVSLTFVSTHHQRMGIKILDVLYSLRANEQHRMKMRSQEDQLIQMYTATELPSTLPNTSIMFYVRVVETIENYSNQLADSQLSDHLWSASQNKEMTDVELVTYDFVGKKIFAAHKALLAARSPVFACMFNAEKPDSPITQLEIPDVEAAVFAHFLSFLYTGRLKTSANNKTLLLAAEKYQVETLINICKKATEDVDIEKLTSAIMFL